MKKTCETCKFHEINSIQHCMFFKKEKSNCIHYSQIKEKLTACDPASIKYKQKLEEEADKKENPPELYLFKMDYIRLDRKDRSFDIFNIVVIAQCWDEVQDLISKKVLMKYGKETTITFPFPSSEEEIEAGIIGWRE